MAVPILEPPATGFIYLDHGMQGCDASLLSTVRVGLLSMIIASCSTAPSKSGFLTAHCDSVRLVWKQERISCESGRRGPRRDDVREGVLEEDVGEVKMGVSR